MNEIDKTHQIIEIDSKLAVLINKDEILWVDVFCGYHDYYLIVRTNHCVETSK